MKRIGIFKLIASLIVISGLTLLIGFKSKVYSITIDDFIDTINQENYECQYFKNYKLDDNTSIDEVAFSRIDPNTVLDFYSFETPKKAQSFYDLLKYNLNEFSKAKPGSKVTETKAARNKTIVVEMYGTEGPEYYRASLKNNTVMYGFTNKGNNVSIDKVFNLVRY